MPLAGKGSPRGAVYLDGVSSPPPFGFDAGVLATFANQAAIALGLLSAAAPAMAAGAAAHPRSGGFSFEGPFGTYDQGQLQRGYKVYHEVCAACHSMNLMHYRNLGDAHGVRPLQHARDRGQTEVVKRILESAR